MQIENLNVSVSHPLAQAMREQARRDAMRLDDWIAESCAHFLDNDLRDALPQQGPAARFRLHPTVPHDEE